MHYPSIEDYKNAVGIPESFATLSYLIPVMDAQGFPVFIAGGPAVVFKMLDSRNRDKCYALKCFTQDQPQRKHHFEAIHQYLKKLDSPYFVDYQYLENELWVNEAEYPALLMEWIEGMTMSRKIEELCSTIDTHGLAQLVYDFNNMAIWMLQQDFAHGDIKPENIQVTPSGNLKLVDYDGMFVPALEGETAPELGTAEYRHPKRSEKDFNENLDDFPLLLLSLSLLSLQKKPELYEPGHNGDCLLFNADDYNALQKSKYFSFFIQEAADDKNISSLFGMLLYAVTIPVLQLLGLQNILDGVNEIMASKTMRVPKNIKEYPLGDTVSSELNEIKAAINPNELIWVDEHGIFFNEAGKIPIWKDKYGILYTADRKKLIGDYFDYDIECTTGFFLQEYIVNNDTLAINCEAFNGWNSLTKIYFPDGLLDIGHNPFSLCSLLEKIIINPNHQFFKFEKGVLYRRNENSIITYLKSNRESIFEVPENIEAIEESAFSYCNYLSEIILNDGIKSIGNTAFDSCQRLFRINLPNTLINIGSNPFFCCRLLEKIFVDPKHSFLKFEDGVLYRKDNMRLISYLLTNIRYVFNIPSHVKEIGKYSFSECKDLREIYLPKGLTTIEDFAFSYCEDLKIINLPKSIKYIGNAAFLGCENLINIIIPKNSRTHFEKFIELKDFRYKIKEE